MWISSSFEVCICVSNSSVSIYSAQLLPFRKPACSSERSLLSSMWADMSWLIILSRILTHRFIREMGLWFCGSSRLSFPLGMRHILAWLSFGGMIVVFQISCISLIVISYAGCPPFWMSSAVMPSGPGALFFGIFWIVFRILARSSEHWVDALLIFGCSGLWYIPCQKWMNCLTCGPSSSYSFCYLFLIVLLMFFVRSHISVGVDRICSILPYSLEILKKSLFSSLYRWSR